jgi:hypothetical protein
LGKTLATVETHLGILEIWGTPPGAEIVVDGKSVPLSDDGCRRR